jgi:hypothetical protein
MVQRGKHVRFALKAGQSVSIGRERGPRGVAGCYTAVMSRPPTCSDAEFHRFVDQHRAQCLWFLRDDYYPRTSAEREAVLRQIAQHGDRDAFRRVAEFRTWLSQPSSETSAGS